MKLNSLKEDALSIFNSGLKAVDTARAVYKHVILKKNILFIGKNRYDLSDYKKIFVIGAGKASCSIAQAIENILGARINEGILNTKYSHSLPLKYIKINEAGHPVPDKSGLIGAQQIVELVDKAEENDLIILLLSGGGSALLPYPAEGITLKDKQLLTKILLESGASIHEINALRKHLSMTKGGHLARIAYPATLVSIILSDVIGDDLDTIASGPAVPDNTTFRQCRKILKKYKMENKVPSSILERIKNGEQNKIDETPKSGDPAFIKTQNLIIGNNKMAAQAALKKAQKIGYNSKIISTTISGETKDIAKEHSALAKKIDLKEDPLKKPACLISGGETTVTIQGSGKGGRNQEFALAAAIDLTGRENIAVLSCGTDGTDGPTDAAGAFADGSTVKRAALFGLDANEFLNNNDSYHFFKKLNDLIITGPTQTNVMDLYILIVV